MMIKNLYISFLTALVVVLSSCNSMQENTEEITKTNEDIFFEHFKNLEGKTFAGKEVFIREDMESWAHLDLIMHIREYTDSVVFVPFRVGDNTSRTWTLYRVNDGRLRLRHDHRHDDGTPEDLNLYGGYTGEGSTAISQFFPADDYTCNMLRRICDNEWNMQFSEDLSTFSYILKKEGVKVIRIDFDLTRAL